jgi:hypothetical protein
MADEVCDVPQTGAQGRYAAEWGLASLLLANVLIMTGVATLFLILLYVASMNSFHPDRDDVRAAGIAVSIVVGFFCLLSLINIGFARVAVRAAWRRCQPGGLPVAGLLLSVVNLVLWSAVLFALVMTLKDLARRNLF